MSHRTKATSDTNSDGVNAPVLSSNHKVIHYLQNSTHCLTNNNNIVINNRSNNNQLSGFQKTSLNTHDLFFLQDHSMNNNNIQQRTRSSSDNSSSISVNDTLSRSAFSVSSSLSDPGGHSSTISSNTSSSGICSTFSDIGHEEGISISSEELDFNLCFDQTNDTGDIDIANTGEIDDDQENQLNSNKNGGDTATLLDVNEANIDERINELEEFLRKSYDLPCSDDDDFDNDDTITSDPTKIQQRTTLLHDSTHTICSQDRFQAYADADEHENAEITSGPVMRSNSLGIASLNRQAALLDKAPKKVVRFADMLGLDLESIRYMTPPDQSTNSLIQECIRIKLEQLRLTKGNSTMSFISTSPLDLPSTANRLYSSPKVVRQYLLVSKYFTSPTNIVPLIYQRNIMLECLYTKDAVAYGTIRVHNCAYDKRVFTRTTTNNWQTHQDIQAWHSMHYPNDNTDAFTFEIRLGKYKDPSEVPKQIYFAVCLQAMCQEFWDNNCGLNYMLEVVERR